MATKTIFITGGIVSGLGKGITAASLGALLKARGFSVVPQKMDPYLNIDSGTLNPFRHGEVFVTDDGAETDLDLGHYERFLDVSISQLSHFTMGKVYEYIMEEERKGAYLGRDIQIVPHVTDELQRRYSLVDNKHEPDFKIIELGGTVGHLEEGYGLEAMRQFLVRHKGQAVSVHVVKMDYLFPSDEGKTRPIQYAVSLLRSYGIPTDVLIVRAKRPLAPEEKDKLSLFCGLESRQIITALDAPSLYDIPLNMEREGLGNLVLKQLGVRRVKPNLTVLKEIARRAKVSNPTIRVALVGKYTNVSDTYLSVIEAAKHAGFANQVKVEVVPIDSENLDMKLLQTVDAVIVPGGFGSRGIEGKIKAIEWVRKNRVPYLGICLGLQTAVIEFARDVIGLKEATSEEFDPKATDRVIAFLPEQAGVTRKGGTMRLGAYEAKMDDSLIARLYRWSESGELDFPALQTVRKLKPVTKTSERHRHRFEVNPEYHAVLKKHGLVFSGMSPNGQLVEFIELPQSIHPYFVATQAHPEFKSRPNRAHPLFAGLIRAAVERK